MEALTAETVSWGRRVAVGEFDFVTLHWAAGKNLDEAPVFRAPSTVRRVVSFGRGTCEVGDDAMVLVVPCSC